MTAPRRTFRRPEPPPSPPPGWIPPHDRPPPDLMPRPTVGPPPPLEVGSWVVVDVVPPIVAEFAWAPPELRLGRVTEGPLYTKGPGGFVVAELWRVDSIAEPAKRYRILGVDVGSESLTCRTLAGDFGTLVVGRRPQLVADLVRLDRLGRLAEVYLADPRVQSEESAALSAPARELAAAAAALRERFAVAEDFRRRQLPALLAGLRDAALCAAAAALTFTGDARNMRLHPQGEIEMAKEQPRKRRHVIVGNQSYGLYYGETDATDAEIVETKSVRLENCRHIAHWRGKTGGITSLAAFGPCGPQARQSRIGAPSPSSLLTGIVNVYDCTPEAVAAFARIEASDA